MKVLIVDDSATIRDRLVEIISNLKGVRHVRAAADASDARRAITSEPPDLIVLDIHMPGETGVQFLKTLRADSRRIVSIVLTNDPAPQRRAASLQAGADFFFDKSAEFQQTIDVIAHLALGFALAGGRLEPAVPQDVSERILAEAELRASENRYRDIFENATDAMFTTDLDLNLTSFNSAAEALTGYTRDEARRVNVAALVTPEALGIIQRELANQLAGKPASLFDAVILARDGRGVPMEVNARLVYRDGHPVGIQGIARDISERKRLEQGLRQAQKM